MTTYPTISASRILKKYVDVPVYFKIPEDPPQVFILLDSSRPVFNTLVTSVSTLIIQGYVSQRTRGADTACHKLLRNAARVLEDHFFEDEDIADVEVECAPYSFPDPDRAKEYNRWQFTAEMIQTDHP